MRWLIIARDGTDAVAPQRRQAARPAHLENAARLQADGHLLVGGALTDAAGNMIGSAAIAQFATRVELDAWLRTDPLRHRRRVARRRGAPLQGRAALRFPALPGRGARFGVTILRARAIANALRNPLATR